MTCSHRALSEGKTSGAASEPVLLGDQEGLTSLLFTLLKSCYDMQKDLLTNRIRFILVVIPFPELKMVSNPPQI